MFSKLYTKKNIKVYQKLFWLYGKIFPVKSPIFITGINRSGTTFIKNMVKESDEIVDWSEANDLWDPKGYPFQNLKTLRPIWPIDPQGYIDSIYESIDKDYINSIPGICSLYMGKKNVFGAKRFLNKSPMNSIRIPLLNELFPGAFYVSTIRDPRAVIYSWSNKLISKLQKSKKPEFGYSDGFYIINKQKYKREKLVKKLAKSYNYIYRKHFKQLEKISIKKKILIKYEDFVNNIHEHLSIIDNKFGINNRRWEDIPVMQKSRNYKYRDNLTKVEKRIIASECRGIMNKFGYKNNE